MDDFEIVRNGLEIDVCDCERDAALEALDRIQKDYYDKDQAISLEWG